MARKDEFVKNQPFKLYVILVAAVAILFLSGSFIKNDSCLQSGSTEVKIGSCSSCWNEKTIEVRSDLCPGENLTCMAQPYVQKHNAQVDILTCACENAKTNKYSNSDETEAIEKLYLEITGADFSAEEICEGQGIQYISKWEY